MKHKKYSALILATALLIIGMRGVCAAQFSQHVEKSKPHQGSLTTPINTSINFVDKSTRAGFNFRVKRYLVNSPSHGALNVKTTSHRICRIRQDLQVNPEKSCKSCETDIGLKAPLGFKQ
jgi:hypothetical protein